MDAKDKYYNKAYMVEGTAARQLQVVPDYEREQQQVKEPQIKVLPRRAPKVSHGVDLISMILLTVTMAITVLLCYNYLQVRGNIVEVKRELVGKEQELSTLLKENAALEEGLNGQVNWDVVYLTAVNRFGMVYPNNNEVVTYESTRSGHVIQYKDIPE